MNKAFLIFLFFCPFYLNAQKTNRHTPIVQKGVYLTFNPHSFLEPIQGAIGLGAGYRFNKHFEAWTELNYLYKGFFNEGSGQTNLTGIRSITSFKYYYSQKHGFFVGAEFRIKNYGFGDYNTFINEQASDTLVDFRYKAKHRLTGGAFFWGKRFKLTGNGKFELEGNVGIGVKQRKIKRENVPPGYATILVPVRKINPVPDNDIEQSLPYFPAIVRFVYHL